MSRSCRSRKSSISSPSSSRDDPALPTLRAGAEWRFRTWRGGLPLSRARAAGSAAAPAWRSRGWASTSSSSDATLIAWRIPNGSSPTPAAGWRHRWCWRSTCAPKRTCRAWPGEPSNASVGSTSSSTPPASCPARARRHPAYAGATVHGRVGRGARHQSARHLPVQPRRAAGDARGWERRHPQPVVALGQDRHRVRFSVLRVQVWRPGADGSACRRSASGRCAGASAGAGKFATEVLQQMGPLPQPPDIPPPSASPT